MCPQGVALSAGVAMTLVGRLAAPRMPTSYSPEPLSPYRAKDEAREGAHTRAPTFSHPSGQPSLFSLQSTCMDCFSYFVGLGEQRVTLTRGMLGSEGAVLCRWGQQPPLPSGLSGRLPRARPWDGCFMFPLI